jgi:hypothetical protein
MTIAVILNVSFLLLYSGGELTKPSINNPILLDVITKVCSNWEKIGLYLGQDVNRLDCHRNKALMDDFKCCIRVFSTWINNDGYSPKYPLNWKSIHKILTAIGYGAIADNMRSKLTINGELPYYNY